MISVCMATRNGAEFLREQLESILPQLAGEDELVVSDDSSTDRTLEILADYHDPRIRLFPGNTFFSPIYNLENALRRARGDILVPADQDDVWLPSKLEVVRSRLEGREQAVLAILMDGYLVDAAGRRMGRTLFEEFRAGKGLWKNLYRNCYTGCAMAFTRPLLDLALPFPRGIPMHDSWLGLLAELHGEVEFVPEATLCHRRHGGNVSGRSRNPLRLVSRRLQLAYHLWNRSRLLAGQGERRRSS